MFWLQKFEDRKQGVAKLIRAASTQVDKKKWEGVENALLRLGVEAQSSDYTDPEAGPDEAPALLTTVPHYRRHIFSSVFEDLDQQSRQLKQKVAREAGKRIRQKPTRERIRTATKSRRSTAHKLPKSCYHRRFLHRLDPLTRDEMHIDETEVPVFDKWVNTLGDSSDSMEED